jgi:hypothetical protein
LDKKFEVQAKIHPEQIKRRRVINLDNPFRDHSYYWVNKDLVMPRIARAINGGTGYPWPRAGITPEKVERHIKGVAMLLTLRLSLTALVLINMGFLFWHDGWRSEVLERFEAPIVRLPGSGDFYCQASNGVLHSSRYQNLPKDWGELSPEQREIKIKELGLTPGKNDMMCLLQSNFLKRDLGQFALTVIVATFTALVGVGLYQSVRSWRFGEIS